MRGRRNQHEWEYQGHDTETKVEYSNCELCGKWRYHPSAGEGFTFIKKSFYNQRMKEGKVRI